LLEAALKPISGALPDHSRIAILPGSAEPEEQIDQNGRKQDAYHDVERKPSPLPSQVWIGKQRQTVNRGTDHQRRQNEPDANTFKQGEHPEDHSGKSNNRPQDKEKGQGHRRSALYTVAFFNPGTIGREKLEVFHRGRI
jgi:hypothetical protein